MGVKEDGPESRLVKSENEKPSVFHRSNVDYEDYSSRFRQKTVDFSKQFCHVYACRLAELRPILVERAEKIWDGVPIVKLADLEHQEDKKCIIIGTLYKHQQWKPSILWQLSEETAEEKDMEHREDYCDEKDQPFLEDEMLRIKLVGDKFRIEDIVTGVVCAILGHKTENGTFDVEDQCFPNAPLQSIENKVGKSKGKLVLISTLDLMKNADSLSTKLLSEWLNGMAGNMETQSEQAGIVRVVIAGNSVSSTTIDENEKDFLTNATMKGETLAKITDALGQLDDWLDEILGQCCVTLMPGQYDPTSCMLPQNPLHRFMLKKSFRYENFKGASNPWIGKIGGRLVTGSSGQPIEDIMRVSGINNKTSALEWLERTLTWRHLCPTAPDTLPSQPYREKDLFIMKDCPDIYFVGNAESFQTKLWKGEDGQTVRLICVPRFCSTKSVVVVDLETLDTEIISFGTN